MGHVTDESLGHVTGREEKELYLPLYKWVMLSSATISMGHVIDESLVREWRRSCPRPKGAIINKGDGGIL
jgi:hypothetical protein